MCIHVCVSLKMVTFNNTLGYRLRSRGPLESALRHNVFRVYSCVLSLSFLMHTFCGKACDWSHFSLDKRDPLTFVHGKTCDWLLLLRKRISLGQCTGLLKRSSGGQKQFKCCTHDLIFYGNLLRLWYSKFYTLFLFYKCIHNPFFFFFIINFMIIVSTEYIEFLPFSLLELSIDVS